jgi:hypothetical protein
MHFPEAISQESAVHASLSLQFFLEKTHSPFAGLQVVKVHASGAGNVTGVLIQTP